MPDPLNRLSAAFADRYRIERELDAGGMATVYLAEDLKHHRKVALKVLRPDLAAALGSERFLKEIHTTANLQHPHILPLFDSGEAGGFLFYVMPYVEGESLRRRLARQRLDLADMLTITRQVAGALDYAHGKGVVHRDIKPENILLQHGLALVADFGIALAAGVAGGERMTETGTSLGTPAYMSPEQVAGDRTITSKSDIYSLGCMVFEMLAGEPPYAAPTSAAMIARRFTEPIPEVSKVRSDVPRQADRVLAQALAPDPAQRPRSAGALAAALQQALAVPSRATPPSQRKSIVVLPFDNMSPDPSDAYLGNGLTEELTSRLSKLGSLRVISRTSAMQVKRSDKELSAIARELDVRYVLEGSVRKAGGALRITAQLIDGPKDEHLWSETYSGTVEDVFGMQEKVSLAIVDALRVELSPDEAQRFVERPFQSFQALQFYIRAMADMWLLSEDSLGRSLEIVDRGLATVGENDLLLVARGFAFFQYVNTMSKAPPRYGAYLEEAQACADRALVINPRSGPAHNLQAAVLWARGDMRASASHSAKAVQLDPNNPEALLFVGYLRAAGGWDPDGAWRLLELLQSVDPLTPINRGALGWLHWYNGDFDEAISAFLEWRRAMDEGKSPFRIFLAYVHAVSGDIEEAVRIIDGIRMDTPHHLLASLGTFLKHAWHGEKGAALVAVTEDLEEAARWDDAWPLMLASGYALISQHDRAFYWLERAIDWGITNVAYLSERDPFLANLRSDARFREVLAKAARLAEEHMEAATRPLEPPTR